MRRILILLLVFSTFRAHAQIDSLLGVFPLDSCKLDIDVCSWLELDTARSGQWVIGTPAKPFFGTAFNPPNAIMTDTVAPYDTSAYYYFDLHLNEGHSFAKNYILSFWHKYQTDSTRDGGFVEVSVDSGTTWIDVTELSSGYTFPFVYEGTRNFYENTDLLHNGHPGFSGQSNGWRFSQFQLILALPVKTGSLEGIPCFRFGFVSDSISDSLDGWMIDDIRLHFADPGSAICSCAPKYSFTAYPNPFSDAIGVEYFADQPRPLRIRWTDVLGRTLLQGEYADMATLEEDLARVGNTLPRGQYPLHVSDGESQSVQLLIKR